MSRRTVVTVAVLAVTILAAAVAVCLDADPGDQ